MTETSAAVLLKQGIAAAKAGNKAQTRRLLEEVIRLDPGNETAWLWLAGVAEGPDRALHCLRRVEELNPANDRARRALRETLLQAGIAAVRAQDRGRARALLFEATQRDRANEMVWLWYAGVVESAEQAIDCLERVLELNPANERARAGIAYYRSQQQPAAPVWECPLCQATADAEHDPCPACGALLSLQGVEVFARHTTLDPHRISAAVEQLTSASGLSAFERPYRLGLAYLNQKLFAEAAGEFGRALRARPDHQALRGHVEALTRYLAARKAEEEQAAREKANRKTVLIVDDSPTVRKLVTMTMERHGYRVVAAADASEAIDQLRERGLPHLVLLDITMPGMDGYQLCKLLRQSRETAHLPIVMLSGKDGFFNKIRGSLAGSTEYVTKPFQPEQLVRIVEKYCKAG